MGNDSRTFSRTGPNALRPALMSPAERRAELCALLALGLVRLRARQSSETSADPENGLLDCAADQSGHATAIERRSA
ncbi:hypothetical protein D8676_22765 [Mesorhizobium sp. YM1C-6-2]|nr:hypothetical protein D8676_22765 [Mesorhizobium sp. YM1C-6-2]